MENIIFDLGRVLISFDPQKYLDEMFADPQIVNRLHKIIFLGPEWIMLDRGVITQDQAVERLSMAHPELSEQICLVFAHWFGIMTPIEGTVKILRELHGRVHKLYVISNFHKEAFEYIFEKFDWFKLFHGLTISCYIQSLKPEPEIYKHLLDKHGLDPQKSIFIDDMWENIEAAQEFGIQGIHYESVDQLKMELEFFLGTTLK